MRDQQSLTPLVTVRIGEESAEANDDAFTLLNQGRASEADGSTKPTRRQRGERTLATATSPIQSFLSPIT
jgi:hypothetical protein